MSTTQGMVSVRATERIVDAINTAVEIEGDVPRRIEFLLRRLQELLDRRTRCAMWLMEQLARDPVPILRSRMVIDPDVTDYPSMTLAIAQAALEDTAPLAKSLITKVLNHIRTPQTLVISTAAETECFERVLLPRYLKPLGCVDCMLSMWAATHDRAVMLLCHRRDGDPPFTESDCALISLMLRAAAPILDREIEWQDTVEGRAPLSPREREILAMLLAGDSEKEIAARLHRSTNTVHTFVQRLYKRFNVSSRGELMAIFVDQAVLASLRSDVEVS